MFTVPQAQGPPLAWYYHVLTLDRRHTAAAAVSYLAKAISALVEDGIIKCTKDPITMFCDNASVFASGEMAYGALHVAAGESERPTLCYHACYHGKTPLDANFAHVKAAIGQLDVERWPTDEDGIRQAIQGRCASSFRDGGEEDEGPVMARTKFIWFPSSDELYSPRRRLAIRDISCITDITLYRTGDERVVDTLSGPEHVVAFRAARDHAGPCPRGGGFAFF